VERGEGGSWQGCDWVHIGDKGLPVGEQAQGWTGDLGDAISGCGTGWEQMGDRVTI